MEPNENASVGTLKTEAFEDADIIRLFIACAGDYCSIFEQCDGENAAKTIVWTDACFGKNGAFRKQSQTNN